MSGELPCEECRKKQRQAQFIGVGAGLLIGSGLCFLAIRFVFNKK